MGRISREKSDAAAQAVRAGRVLVEHLAREVPARGDEFGRDALADEPLREALVHERAPRVLPEGRVVDRVLAHLLDAAGDHDVVAAGDDALRRERCGLLARAALAVDRGAGNGDREARRECGVAADVHGLLADLGEASGDHVIDQRRVEVVAGDQFFEHGRQQVHRVEVGERSAGLCPGRMGFEGCRR